MYAYIDIYKRERSLKIIGIILLIIKFEQILFLNNKFYNKAKKTKMTYIGPILKNICCVTQIVYAWLRNQPIP